MYKIYALQHPITKNIFYIGVTSNSLSARLSQHMYDARRFRGKNKAKDEIIRELDEVGLRPNILLVEGEIFDIDDADLAESLYIDEYNEKYELTNVKPGGYDYRKFSARCDIYANGWLN